MPKTSKQIAKEYMDAAYEMAKSIDKFSEQAERFRYLQEVTHDNGDPAMKMDDAVRELGVALSTIVIYGREYLDEEEKTYGEPYE